jgi:uncharacterized membrane protein YoaT (DUF817 family)
MKKISLRYFFLEFRSFILKEARASFFAGSFLFIIFVSKYVHVFGLYRYDFLFLSAIAIQILMLVFKLETKDEAKVILLFHVIGFALEVYKTSPMIGSWSYPEAGYFKLWNVPLYSGFMYASIGSYIAGAWKVLNLRLIRPPRYYLSVILCFLIYLNFFTNHFIFDYRILLIACVFVLYFGTRIAFTPRKREYTMPITIGLMLVAVFFWIAENIGTFYGAWKYPSQIHAWQVVSLQKITSWFLMVIISFIIVAYLKHVKENRITELSNK